MLILPPHGAKKCGAQKKSDLAYLHEGGQILRRRDIQFASQSNIICLR